MTRLWLGAGALVTGFAGVQHDLWLLVFGLCIMSAGLLMPKV